MRFIEGIGSCKGIRVTIPLTGQGVFVGTPWLLWTMLYGQTSLHFFRIGFEIGKQSEWREGSGKNYLSTEPQ